MTVEEVIRGVEVRPGSPLQGSLLKPTGGMSAVQAVACLGRSLHVVVARQVTTLLGQWALRSLVSAYSGVDTFAAAMDAETDRRRR